jgi:3-oxoacyl-[acyl-carrier protein] reductase
MAEGKVALVTGGSRGIGAAIVRALAGAGYTVAFSYRVRKAEADAICSALAATGKEAKAFACDVGDAGQCDRLVADTMRAYGRIDALVNNAGTHVPGVLLGELADDDWARVIAVNMTAPFRLARAVLPAMRNQGGGNIVTLSSNITRRMAPGYGVYAVSKAGLEAFTQVLAKEEGRHGIRVNGIGPGPIRTDMLQESFDVIGQARADALVQSFALGRLGEPEEIAAVVVFLVSDAASYLTGQIVYVNGGGV